MIERLDGRGWREVGVAELISAGSLAVNDGYRVRNVELGSIGTPFVRGGDIGANGEIHTEVADHVLPQFEDRLASKFAAPGDVAFISKGTVGRVGRIREGQPRIVFAPQVCFWRSLDPDTICPAFLYYVLTSNSFQSQLDAVRTHGSMVADYVSLADQRAFSLLMPPIADQRAIAAVLGALDDKIEQNRRTGAKLEGLARGVFKAWFVDFEPVKAKAAGATAFPGMPPETFAALPTRFTNSDLGPVPQGWEVRSLYSTATFINGAAFKSSHFCDPSSGIPVVKIAELKAGITEQTKHSSRTDLDSRYRIDTGEILYSWSGSPDTSMDTFIWTKGPGLLNQHIFRVVTESEAQKIFVYYLLKHLKQDLIEIARNKQTTGLGHVTVGDMQRLLLAWPDPKTLNGFREVIGPVFAIAFNGLLESEKLAALRDYLLPRLLSGRVRVRANAPKSS